MLVWHLFSVHLTPLHSPRTGLQFNWDSLWDSFSPFEHQFRVLRDRICTPAQREMPEDHRNSGPGGATNYT